MEKEMQRVILSGKNDELFFCDCPVGEEEIHENNFVGVLEFSSRTVVRTPMKEHGDELQNEESLMDNILYLVTYNSSQNGQPEHLVDYGLSREQIIQNVKAGKYVDGAVYFPLATGKKPKGYGDVFIYVTGTSEIIRISEGTGDNLLCEDREEGFVDYIYYEQYKLGTVIEETDGGMVLMKELFRDKYDCTADCIPEVLMMAYGHCVMDFIILK